MENKNNKKELLYTSNSFTILPIIVLLCVDIAIYLLSGFPGWSTFIYLFYGGQILLCAIALSFTTIINVSSDRIEIEKPFMPFYDKKTFYFDNVESLHFNIFRTENIKIKLKNEEYKTMFIQLGNKKNSFKNLLITLRDLGITVTYNDWGERG
jgi:hypothetical protein